MELGMYEAEVVLHTHAVLYTCQGSKYYGVFASIGAFRCTSHGATDERP
jgi:hypothetical protein